MNSPRALCQRGADRQGRGAGRGQRHDGLSGGDALRGHDLTVHLHLGGGAVSDHLDGLTLEAGIHPPGVLTVTNGAFRADKPLEAATSPALVMFAAEALGAVGLGAPGGLAVEVREALAAAATGVVVVIRGGGGGLNGHRSDGSRGDRRGLGAGAKLGELGLQAGDGVVVSGALGV